MSKSTVRLSDGRTIVVERHEIEEPPTTTVPCYVEGPPIVTLDGEEISLAEARRLVEADLPALTGDLTADIDRLR